MKTFFYKDRNGYQESIRKGLDGVRQLSGDVSFGTETKRERIEHLKEELRTADAILIGAGAGLSTAAGLTYSGERFEKYFFDFARAYGIQDIYSGGFFPFPDDETRWAWWARHIYFNRYIDPPKPVYQKLLSLVRDREYFVITTNVDHQFQRAGFDKKRLFYTQGDYGLFQSVDLKVPQTYDNEAWTMRAMEAQGFVRDENGIFCVPENQEIMPRIPTALIPAAPNGDPVTMNLRSDDTFVEDSGWHQASSAYADFLSEHENDHVLYMEIGVGGNTPVIIKYPFWQRTMANPNAVYACLNYDDAFCPSEIENQSVCIEGDFTDVLFEITQERSSGPASDKRSS